MWSKGRESMPCGILELTFVLWHSIGTPKGSPPCCGWQAWVPWRPLELCRWELYLLVGPHKRHCKPGRRCSKQESKAESTRSPSWCMAGTEEVLTLQSWTRRGDYSWQKPSKMHDGWNTSVKFWTDHHHHRFRYARGRDRPGCQHQSPGKEIIAAIKSLENGKSSRQDNLSAEVFKADPQLADLLQTLFTDIWEGKKLPEDWTEGVIVKIPKKGAPSNCNNWWAITLLSVPSKILAKIIIQRIANTVD